MEDREIYISGIEHNSFVNGDGCRFTIFMSGCNHRCKWCHNEETWSPTNGTKMKISDIISQIKRQLPVIDGVTLTGGDPFYNKENLLILLKEIKSLNKDLSIWVYTGYYMMNLYNDTNILKYIDVLVDGPYIDLLKCDSKYIGSSNQNIIKLKDGAISSILSYDGDEVLG